MPSLRRADLADDPIAQFGSWWKQAEDVPLRDAMTLATVDSQGRPDARMVLLKGFDGDGFRFFTNYESQKAVQLDEAGQAALVIYWRELDRQVRVRGFVDRLGAEDSDAYFASRPRESQLGAWASPQSGVLADRSELDARLADVSQRFGDEEIARPAHWGGYVVRHEIVEFWQGQVGRLHDRFVFSRAGEAWKAERLGP